MFFDNNRIKLQSTTITTIDFTDLKMIKSEYYEQLSMDKNNNLKWENSSKTQFTNLATGRNGKYD